ncbi:MAG: diguanylate cyclase [Haliea sp.]|nr:diguanylate cyclase [Haliea sp.]
MFVGSVAAVTWRNVPGVLALYTSEMNFFHQDEMKLLEELAVDIAFGIDHIDKQDQLNYLAYYDTLTGLANRSLFQDRLTQNLHARHDDSRLIATVLLNLTASGRSTKRLPQYRGQIAVRCRRPSARGFRLRAARINADMFGLSGARRTHGRQPARRPDGFADVLRATVCVDGRRGIQA